MPQAEPWCSPDMPDEIVVELRPLGRYYPDRAAQVWRAAKRLGQTQWWWIREMVKAARPPPGARTRYQWTKVPGQMHNRGREAWLGKGADQRDGGPDRDDDSSRGAYRRRGD